MTKKLILLLFLGGLLTSCGAKKNFSYQKSTNKSNAKTSVKAPSKQVGDIVNYAKSFLGTKYKYGGTSKRGLDCSGLVYLSFLNGGDVSLPRVSRLMAQKGKRISTVKVRMGDLLFFKTEHSSGINHVGLVTKVVDGEINFIHSTTHAGVIISQLSQKYWINSFSQARRLL